MRRRIWQPARLTTFEVVLVTAVFTVVAGVRGIDYFLAETATPALTSVERAFGGDTMLLGLWFLLGAALLVFGMIRASYVPVRAGHAVLVVAYAGVAAGLWGMFIADGLDGLGWGGFRTPAGFTGPLVLHAILGWRTSARPQLTRSGDRRA